jgi:hypothetical protein
MGRANLGKLLGNVAASTPSPIIVEPESSPLSGALGPQPKLATDDATTRIEPVSPRYLRFVRKDTRLREDQLEALTSQARRLTKARQTAGERITENTLIRIAVDLLLDRVGNASGDDESALLKSVR